MKYGDIMEMLAARHSDDVFVPECKDGPSYGRNHVRMDAWAMAKSYSRFRLTGYEIKMNRADFLRDEKYPLYLPFCNCLWFVAPCGVLDPKELPEEVGLLQASKTGSRLFTKKKAPIRTIKPPVSLYEYLLISRTRVKDENTEMKERAITHREADFDAYLRGEIELKDIGFGLGEKVWRDVRELTRRAESAERNVDRDQAIRERLVELGFNPDAPIDTWGIDQKLRQRGLLAVGRTKDAMKTLIVQIQRSLDQFETKTNDKT
jgi:hypothetical protein